MPATPDDVVSLVFFARVVEAQSFTRAAAKLGVSKSLVSTRLSQLEDRLGTRLLMRTTRRISVTAEGLALYERAQRMVAEADAATSLAAGAQTEPRGVLRVSAPVTFAELYLTAPIATYLERYPEARVDLRLSDRFIDLVEEGIDVALRVSARLRDSSLVGRKLADDHTVVCASPAYLARHGTPETPADLLHHDCVRYTLLKTADEWRFRDESGSFSVPVEGRFEAGSGSALRDAAVAGLGIAILPYFIAAPAIRAKTLVPLLEPYTYIRLALHAVYAPARVLPVNVRAFVDVLAAHFRTPPWMASDRPPAKNPLGTPAQAAPERARRPRKKA